jgi:hypothetical protein
MRAKGGYQLVYAVIRTITIKEPVPPDTIQTDVFIFENEEIAKAVIDLIPDRKNISYHMLEETQHADLNNVLDHVS